MRVIYKQPLLCIKSYSTYKDGGDFILGRNIRLTHGIVKSLLGSHCKYKEYGYSRMSFAIYEEFISFTKSAVPERKIHAQYLRLAKSASHL